MAKETKRIKIKDLDFYPREDALSNYRFVEEDPVFMESQMKVFRESATPLIKSTRDQLSSLNQICDNTKAAYNKAYKYLTHEETAAIPKAVAITVGGMGGFLLSLRRGGAVKRVIYTGAGLGLTASFCYPHETLDLARSVAGRAQTQWKDFTASPAPVKSVATKKEEVKEQTSGTEGKDAKKSKDIDMYTTRSDKIS